MGGGVVCRVRGYHALVITPLLDNSFSSSFFRVFYRVYTPHFTKIHDIQTFPELLMDIARDKPRTT